MAHDRLHPGQAVTLNSGELCVCRVIALPHPSGICWGDPVGAEAISIAVGFG